MFGLSIQFLQKFIFLINSVKVDRLKKNTSKKLEYKIKCSMTYRSKTYTFCMYIVKSFIWLPISAFEMQY